MVIQTSRLTLSELSYDDYKFIVRLLNEPAFLEHIGDKNVADRQSATKYLDDGPLASYRNNGFGLLKVSVTETGEAVGICGLVFRDYLPCPDLGFAMLESNNGLGFGYESSQAVIGYAANELKLNTICAITSLLNEPSVSLLKKLGFVEPTDRPDCEQLTDLNYFELSLNSIA